MPVSVPVPKGLKVILKITNGPDTDVQNILHFQYTGTAPSAADLNEMADDIVAAWSSNVAPLMVVQTILESVEVLDLTSASSAVGISSAASNAGSLSTEGVPSGTAMVMSYIIARRYRGGHPRSYLTGMPVNILSNANTWGSAGLAALVGAWNLFTIACSAAADFGGGTSNQVNISYFSGFTNHTYPSGRVRAIPNPRATPLVDLITGVRGNPKVASQRRRNLQGS